MHFPAADQTEIAYADETPETPVNAPPVLLIHGFASTRIVNWVNTGWVRALRAAGRRVVSFDNRGHGLSGKPHAPAAYSSDIMAGDALALLDHLHIRQADVIGYSMGARIAAHLALRAPERVRRLVLGGLGIHLVEGVGLPPSIAEALEAPELADLTDPMQRMFRAFADANHADRVALAACIRGSRQVLSVADVGRITQPVLVAIGTADDVSGAARPLAALMPNARVLDIEGRDHNRAVGDAGFKTGVLRFLDAPDMSLQPSPEGSFRAV